MLRTCVPGKSSLALLIMMFVHEDLRSSAIVSPPFPMMWPETLLKNEIQRSRSDQIHALLTAQYICTFLRKHNEIFLLKTSTLATSTWELTFSSGCPSLPPGASLRYSRFLSRCQCSSTASPWIWILRACSTQMRINNHRFFASSRALSSDPFVS